MSRDPKQTLKGSDIKEGDALTPFDLALTTTMIVAGAIASHDYMPVHHDRDYAQAQGAPDVFMNILSTNGYVARYVTDWAGPEAMLTNIKIRLGVPAVPNQVMHFTGEVLKVEKQADDYQVEVSVRMTNDFGDHATGTVTLSLPLD